MVTFLANEINTTKGDMKGPNYVSLNDKIMQGI